MSSFPTNPSIQAPIIEAPSLDPSQPQTEAGRAVEGLIRQNRRVTPPAAVDMRQTPRASIAELNSLDQDTIKERLASQPHDNRGMLLKVTDLLDAGRDAVWNVLSPHLAAEHKAAGDRATFGMGRVNASDVLNEPSKLSVPGQLATIGAGAGAGFAVAGPVGAAVGAGLGALPIIGIGLSQALQALGLQKHVVNGIIGFAADTGTNPALFVGPVGGVAKLTSEAGRGIEVLSGGVKAVRAADAALAAGTALDEASPITKILRLKGVTPESVAARADAGEDVSGLASKTLIGDIQGGPLVSRLVGDKPAATLADKLTRVPGLGAGLHGKGGAIAEYFGHEGATDATEQALSEAAKEFVGQYGYKSAKGHTFGAGGSMVAHVPFTNIGVQVPAFTAAGKIARENALIASGGPGIAARAMTPLVQKFADGVKRLDDVGTLADQAADMYPDAHAALAGERDAIGEELRQLAKQAADPATPTTANDLLALRPMIDKAEATATKAHAEAESLKATVAIRSRVNADIAQRSERAGADVRDAVLGTLSPEEQAAASLTDAETKIHSTNVDWLHARMEANVRLAQATKGSIRAFLNPADADMAGVAARALGTDSAIMGASVLTPLKTVLGYAGLKPNGTAMQYVERAEGAFEHVFGRRSGVAGEYDRFLKNTLTHEQRYRATQAMVGIRDGIRDALVDTGLDPVDHMDDAAHLTTALAIQERAAQGGDNGTIWTTKFGSDEPAEFLQRLAKAQENGLFSKDATGGLLEKLRGIAKGDLGLNLLDHLGDTEIEDALLGKQIEGYVPHIATGEARDAIQATFRQPVSPTATAAAKAGRGIGESFQKERQASLEYRFESQRPGMEGQPRRFLKSDLGWFNAQTAGDLKAIEADPETSKEILEKIADVQEYLSLKNPPAPRYLDPFAMNELYKQGRFDMLTGGRELPGGFADSNWATMMAARVGMHERAAARATWRQYMTQFGVTVPADLQGKLGKDGESILMRDGSVARVRRIAGPGGEEIRGIDWGGQFYRPLSANVKGLEHNPVLNGLAISPTDGTLYHSTIADKIENGANLFATDVATRKALRVFDDLTRLWKSTVLLSPGWTTSNSLGDSMNAFMGGARPADFSKHASQMMKLFWHEHDPEVLRRLSFPVGNQTLNGEQLLQILQEHRVAESNLGAETAAQAIQAKLIALPSAMGERGPVAAAMNPLAAAATVPKDYRFAANAYAAAARMDKPDLVSKIRAADFVMDDRMMQWVFGPWFRVNTKVSNTIRGLAFLSHLEQGNDIQGAAKNVIHSMFDIADLSKVEKGLFRRLIPFYSWWSRNMVYHMQLLVTRPIFAGSFPHLRDAIEETTLGDDRVPEYQRPAWMREQLAMQIGRDPESRTALLLGSLIPNTTAEDALTPLFGKEGAQHFAHTFLGNLSPLIKKPLEFAAGRDFFSGKEINADPLLSEVPPAGFASELVRPINNAQKVSEAYREGGLGPAVARAAFGGRAQSLGEGRTHQRLITEYRNTAEHLSATVRRAEFAGDKATSLAARTRLMELYREAMRAGVGDQVVPHWARATFAST